MTSASDAVVDDAQTTPATPATPAKVGCGRGQYRRSTEKLTAAALLIANGLTPRQAADAVGYRDKNEYNMVGRIKRKGLDEFLTKKRVKTAVYAIDKLMAAEPFGELTAVKDSTVLAAAQSVIDRKYPKQQEIQAQNVSFTSINLTLAALDARNNATPTDIPPIEIISQK